MCLCFFCTAFQTCFHVLFHLPFFSKQSPSLSSPTTVHPSHPLISIQSLSSSLLQTVLPLSLQTLSSSSSSSPYSPSLHLHSKHFPAHPHLSKHRPSLPLAFTLCCPLIISASKYPRYTIITIWHLGLLFHCHS